MALRNLTQTVHRSVYPAIDPSTPANSALNKTVIISGGASGIGYAIAQGFSVAGAATVVLLARRQEALDEASARLRTENSAAERKTAVWTYLLDIRDSTAAESVFDAIRKRLNSGNDGSESTKDADILVTSAASLAQGQSTLDIEPQTYRDSFETNLVGNLNVVRAFLAPELPTIPFTGLDGKVKNTKPVRVPHQQKIILDVASSASYAIFPGQSSYSASKLAFTRAMQYLQREVDQLEGSPIRIHSFNPGVILSPGAKAVVGTNEAHAFEFDEETLPYGFAVWLASPAAAFLKGRFIMSSWDVEELIAMKDKFEEDPEFCTITLKM